ncbi:hypothetical protein GGI22_005022, partial [Coemansia erecta]
MGTLSAQIAHLFCLNADAASPSIAAWSPAHLTAQALPWAQHVDLIWPTLDPADQRLVLAQAKRMLDENGRPHASAALPFLLDATTANACQLRLLRHAICNIDTPHDVRIVALHHYSDSVKASGRIADPSSDVAMVIQTQLDPWRRAMELIRVARTLAGHSGHPSEYDELLKEGAHIASAAAALLGALESKDTEPMPSPSIVALVRHTFSSASAPTLTNAILYACIDGNRIPDTAETRSRSLAEFRHLVSRSFISRVFDRDVDPALTFLYELHSSVLAHIASSSSSAAFDPQFGSRYLQTLTRINRRCQDAMLHDCFKQGQAKETTFCTLATSDMHLSRLAAKWH